MPRNWQDCGWQLGTALALGITGAVIAGSDRTLAQIIPDNTLGTNPSQVTLGNQIQGGVKRGVNLFHSFREFNVGTGQTVSFSNPAGVLNILSRVTGTNPSNIFGTLSVLGNANLFLINPNGILFGPGARLDIKGSFVGTTANAIQFTNRGIFSASTPKNPSLLLNINPSAFLFNQVAKQSNSSISVIGTTLSVGTKINPRSLLLVGGDILANQANLEGVGGSQIEVGGFTGTGSVGLSVSRNNLRLELPANGVRGANVFLRDTVVNVGSQYTKAGDILLTGGTLTLTQDSQLSTSTFGVGDAGLVQLQADNNIFIKNSSLFSTAEARASGNAGNILLNAGSVFLSGARLDTTNKGSGIAGDIILQANSLVALRNSKLKTDAASGLAGRIGILAGNLVSLVNSQITSTSDNDITKNIGFIGLEATQGSVLLNHSTVSTTNSGSGFAGDISINAPNQVSILNQSNIFSQGYFGQIFIGESDYASFSPANLRISNSQLKTDSLNSEMRAGKINLEAINQILIANNSNISSKASGDANAGSILLQTNGLVALRNSKLETDADAGLAGGIGILAGDLVSLVNSQITSTSDNDITDDFGFIGLEATQGSVLLNRSIVSTTNSGSGFSGDISISALEQVFLNQSSIFSQGNQGNIFIGESENYASFSPANLRISNSQLKTDSLNSEIQAGNISLEAINQVLITSSNISSKASGDADAGSILLQTNGLVALRNSKLGTDADAGIAGGIGIRAVDLISLVNSQLTSTSTNNLTSDFSVIGLEAIRGSVFLFNNSKLSTTNYGSGLAGDISISAPEQVALVESSIFSRGYLGRIFIGESSDYASFSPNVILLSNAELNSNNSSVEGNGKIDAGLISLRANNSISLVNDSKVTTSTTRQGDAGGILVQANGGNVSLDNSRILSSVATEGLGNGGAIIIAGKSVSLNNFSELTASTFGQGNAGEILVLADNSVVLSQLSSIRSNVEQGGFGKGGQVGIGARSLTLDSGSQIGALVFRGENGQPGGSGQAGDILINTLDFVSISGGTFSPIDNQIINSGILASTEQGAIGNGGSISVTTGNLSLANNGFITASTQNSSDAGSITVTANTVEVTNRGNIASNTSSSGNGGSVFLTVKDKLAVENNGVISVNGSDVQGNPGNINIRAGSVFLNQGGAIDALSASGRNANITMQVGNSMEMRSNSEISAEARNNGDGGNITINARKFVFTTHPENSDIVANAYAGTGGNVTATAQLVQGFTQGKVRTPESDITASSQLSVDGTVTINTQDRLFEPPPIKLVDPTGLIDRRCRATKGSNVSSFTVRGRGGLPANPGDPLRNDNVVSHWVSLDSDTKTNTSPTSVTPRSTTPPQIVEAQGWVIGSNGKVVLTASAPTVTPESGWYSSPICSMSQAPTVQPIVSR